MQTKQETIMRKWYCLFMEVFVLTSDKNDKRCPTRYYIGYRVLNLIGPKSLSLLVYIEHWLSLNGFDFDALMFTLYARSYLLQEMTLSTSIPYGPN